MRRKRGKEARRGLPPTQRELVRDLMLASSKHRLWLTLKQLARLTGYGEASISAQLRHLRKPQYGGFVLQKRCCNEGQIGRGGDPGAIWEYLLSRKPRQNFGVRRLPRRGGRGSALTVDGRPTDHSLVAVPSQKRQAFAAQDKQDRPSAPLEVNRTSHASRMRRGAR